MPSVAKYFTVIAALLICVLSTIALAINDFIYQFPGNNYFPPGMPIIATTLLLLWVGYSLQFGKDSAYAQIIREIIYFFMVVSVIALATNAIQFTPFPPIDKQLIQIETLFHLDLNATLAWTASFPWLKTILSLAYDSLTYQMVYLPLLVIFTRRIRYVREYYALFLLSALIGFSFYYFLPTMGPASFIDSAYFSQQQYDTGIKFREIHHHLAPSTLDGGMIAMPSFHAIWAWLCLYLSRCLPIVFIVLLPINLLLIASCVLIGWHYPIDLFGSLIVLLLTHGIYFYFVKNR